MYLYPNPMVYTGLISHDQISKFAKVIPLQHKIIFLHEEKKGGKSESDDFFCSFFSLLLDMGGQKLHGEDDGRSTDGHAINVVGAKLQYIMHVGIM